jgi:serine protease Do
MSTQFSSFPESFLTNEDKSQFLIQDPCGLREVIQPVVSISQIEDKITGLGTCFQISPWTWMTAQHVVMDNSGGSFPPNEVGAVGFSPGLIFGTVGFTTTDHFGEVTEIQTAKKNNGAPPSLLSAPTGPSIHIDLAILKLNTANLKNAPLVSPLPLSSCEPKIGDEVIGIGFPILGSSFEGQSAMMRFTERMFGASGVVTGLHPQGVSKSRPWPTFEIEGDWRSGMSGGPVVNLAGQIVGVISSSLAPTDECPGVGFAVNLARIPVTPFAPEIDRNNPGWYFGWATFKAGTMTGFFETKEKAQAFAGPNGADEIKRVLCCPKTDSWVEA